MKKTLLVSLALLLAFAAFAAPAAARNDFAKARTLDAMAGKSEADSEDPEPGAGAQPLPQQPPETPIVSHPQTGETVKLFCIFPQEKLGNLEALCQHHKVNLRLYWNFRNLLLLKRVACIVEAPKKNTALLSELYNKFNGRKIGKVELRARIAVRSVYYGVNDAKELSKTGSFEEIDAMVAPIVKMPYGARSRVFHILHQLANPLSVVAREWGGLGKEHRFLFNPTVNLEVVGIDMNGKGRNVTMFQERYDYKTVKRAKNFRWK